MGKTIKDVAAAAGVSTATVSRALAPDNSGPVAERTRLRVKAAAEGLGYRTNHAARSLKTQSTMTIAVVFPELANDFYMDVAEGIEGELSARGYTMLIASSVNSIEEEKKRIVMLADRMVDGMVVIPSGSRGEHLQFLADQGMPMVLVDRIVEGARLDTVTSDNEGGTFLLTRALLSDGFRHIAFVGGEMALSTARERFSGFARAMAEAGIQPDPSWICLEGMGVEDGYRLTEQFLKSRNPPEAMVAVNLLVHLGMERRLLDLDAGSGVDRAAGRRPPVVIAGFDESRYTPFLPACRYAASQDAVGIGKQAGRRIIEKIREKKAGCFGGENSGERIIRLPVTITHHDMNGGKHDS
jgi:LacI family transcriptional regulator